MERVPLLQRGGRRPLDGGAHCRHCTPALVLAAIAQRPGQVATSMERRTLSGTCAVRAAHVTGALEDVSATTPVCLVVSFWDRGSWQKLILGVSRRCRKRRSLLAKPPGPQKVCETPNATGAHTPSPHSACALQPPGTPAVSRGHTSLVRLPPPPRRGPCQSRAEGQGQGGGHVPSGCGVGCWGHLRRIMRQSCTRRHGPWKRGKSADRRPMDSAVSIEGLEES